jgi:peptidoglycan/LPS O-acetylase OafA/YrhL
MSMSDSAGSAAAGPITSASPGPVASGRIPCLDGLRALSVSLVLLGHGSGTIGPDHPTLAMIISAIGMSGVGVSVFFVISGYLITTLLKREKDKTGAISIAGFYVRRMLRIFPAFYSYLIVIFLLSATKVLLVSDSAIASAGLFLWNYSHLWIAEGPQSSWYVGHFWTLSLEEQFYLLWPLTFVLLGGYRSALIAFILIAVMPEVRLASYFVTPGSRGQLGMMLHTALDGIMFGCLLACCEGNPRFERIFAMLNRGAVAILAVAFLFLINPYISSHVRGYSVTYGMTFSYVAITMIIFWCVRNPSGAVGRILQTRGLVYLGTISYGVYLWQQLFLTPFPEYRILAFPWNIPLSVAVAMISYHLIELPIQRLRRKPALDPQLAVQGAPR